MAVKHPLFRGSAPKNYTPDRVQRILSGEAGHPERVRLYFEDRARIRTRLPQLLSEAERDNLSARVSSKQNSLKDWQRYERARLLEDDVATARQACLGMLATFRLHLMNMDYLFAVIEGTRYAEDLLRGIQTETEGTLFDQGDLRGILGKVAMNTPFPFFLRFQPNTAGPSVAYIDPGNIGTQVELKVLRGFCLNIAEQIKTVVQVMLEAMREDKLMLPAYWQTLGDILEALEQPLTEERKVYAKRAKEFGLEPYPDARTVQPNPALADRFRGDLFTTRRNNGKGKETD